MFHQSQQFKEMDVNANSSVSKIGVVPPEIQQQMPSPSKTFSGGEENKQMSLEQKPCICNRPASKVVCSTCNKSFTGRVVLSCPAHPNRRNLMDQRVCVSKDCRSRALVEHSG